MTLTRQFLLIAWRSLVRTLRQPGTVIPPLIFPLMLMAVNSNGLRAATHLPGFPTRSFLAFFIPFGYLMDRVTYRTYTRRLGSQAKKPAAKKPAAK